MPIQGILLSLLLLFVGCASKERNNNLQQADLYFGAGTQALMEQDYTTALSNLLKAHELQPSSSEVLTNLAMAYYFKGQRDLAVKSLQQALKLNPSNSDARVNLASIYFNDGQLTDAEKIYHEVLKDLTYDKQARTYYNLALIELRLNKNSQKAEQYLLSSIKEDVNYCPSHLKLGQIQYQRRMLQNALRTFKEASRGTCYDSAAPHYYQALTLEELGRRDEARLKYEEVINRFSEDPFALQARTRVIGLNNNNDNFRTLESRSPRKVLESPEF